MDQLRIDPTLLFASAAGSASGLARADLVALAGRLAAAVRAPVGAEDAALLDPVLDFVASAQGRFRAVVVLAGPEEAAQVRAIHTALVSPHAALAPSTLPLLLVLDSADPDVVGEFLDAFDASECLFVVAARDGDAVGPLAPFRIVREEMRTKLGDEGHKDHVVFACEPAGGELREIARAEGYVTFGSAGGAVGPAAAKDRLCGEQGRIGPAALLPCALVGVDVKGLVAGAAAMEEACTVAAWESNPALLLASVRELFARRKRRCVTCACARRLRDLAALGDPHSGGGTCRPGDLGPARADWNDAWVSLLAVDEADHKLTVPPAGAPSKLAHVSLNDLFAAEREHLRQHLVASGTPNLTIHFPSVNAHAVGQFLALERTAEALRSTLAAPG